MAMATLLLLLLLLLLHPHRPSATYSSLVGINYGLVGDNLPFPTTVMPLLRSIGVGRVKLYNPDPAVLRAFADTGVEFIVGLPDRCLAQVSNPSAALSWVRSNVQAYLPRTKIAAITVGNEVLTNMNDTSLSSSLLPAMESIHSALAALGLDRHVSVTTSHSVAILSTSYPPSAGTFRKELLPLLCPILAFHARTGSPMLINAYPYFAYQADPGQISLDYVLFQPNPGVVDPATGLKYMNMLHAQVDAVYAAIAVAGVRKGVEVRISETGWPSGGDPDEKWATPENAAKYNGNLMKLVMEEKGTPARPGAALRVYVFALFNENQKPGPLSERNYGLFKPDGTPSYHLDITVPPENSTTSGGGGGGGGGGSSSGGGEGDSGAGSNGYYSISSATAAVDWVWQRTVWTIVMATVVGASLLLV